tara:strand:+ start:442 stop:837 length:396 start_codon:yes stop_codon:yes gene_type:complete
LVHFAENVDFDILVFIQPTSPLLRSEDIDGGLNILKDYDSVFSAYTQHWIPSWTENIIPNSWDINNRPMRQNMEKTYIENGAFYITTKKLLIKNKNRYSGKIGMYLMPFIRSIQIDSHEDLELVRKIINIL